MTLKKPLTTKSTEKRRSPYSTSSKSDPVTAVIYARYSSEKQTEQSIEGQLRVVQKYAEQHGIAIVGEYIDRAVTGRTDNRVQFKKMISDSGNEENPFNAVIVYSLDRFSRSRYDSAMYRAILQFNGVKLLSATENIPEGAAGILYESLLEGMAEYYSAELSQKVKRGMYEAALKCRSTGGQIPLGYKIEDGKFIINEDTAPIVRKIFAMYNEGHASAEICRVLNGHGLKSSSGAAFNKNSLRSILKNKKYIGVYKCMEIEIKDGVPAIVEVEVFNNVQRLMGENNKNPQKFKNTADYLLTGKIYCGECGGGMSGTSGTNQRKATHYYYQCVNKTKKTCEKKNIRKDWIENAVVAETIKNVLQPDIIDAIAEACVAISANESRNDEELNHLQKQLKDTEKSINGLMTAIEEGIITKTTKSRLKELEEIQERLEFDIKILNLNKIILSKDDIKYMLSHFIRESDEPSEEYNADIIKCFINSVYVYDDKIIITYNIASKKNNSELMSSDLSLICANSCTARNGDPLAVKSEHYLIHPVHLRRPLQSRPLRRGALPLCQYMTLVFRCGRCKK